MTTVQLMFRADSLFLRVLLTAAVIAALQACQGGNRRADLVPPEILVAPYDTSNGDALWAVAPLGNESGVSIVDTDVIADTLVAKLNEVRGLSCLPLNRTFAAMRSRNLRVIRTPADARMLASTLGVDALLVGNVTAYDPYDPPKLGLSLAVFSRDRQASEPFDPMRLRTSYSDSDYRLTNSQFADKPVAVISEHLDGASHDVQLDLQRYAAGRHDGQNALGWKAHLANMSLYTEFAAHFAVARLLDQERLRVGLPPATPPRDRPAATSAQAER